MATHTQSIGSALSSILKVEIQKGSLELMQDMDPAHQYVKNTATSVRPGEGIGRDWKWKQPVHTGVAGAGFFRNLDVQTQFTNTTSAITDVAFANSPQQLSLVQSFPTHLDAAYLGFHQYTVQLCEWVANMFFPQNLLRANQLNALVQEVVALNIKGFVRNKAMAELRCFYTSGTTGGGSFSSGKKSIIGTIAAVSSGGTTTDYAAICTLSDARIKMFPVGSQIDIYDTSDNRKYANWRVIFQDLVNKKITIGPADGSAIGNAIAGSNNVSAGNLIAVSAGSLQPTSTGVYPYGCQGLSDWIVSSGTIQGVDTALLPNLLSYVDSTSQALSEPLLNKYFGAFQDAYGPNLDTAITTTGVMNKWAESLRAGFGVSSSTATPYTIDRSGPLNVTQGFSAINYTYGGKNIKIFASPFCPTGYFYAFKTAGGNLMRLTPPKIPGMGSSSEFGNEVEFIAAYDGSGNIWKNYHSNPSSTTVSTTDIVECPMSCVYNYAIKEPQGIKFTALQEDIA